MFGSVCVFVCHLIFNFKNSSQQFKFITFRVWVKRFATDGITAAAHVNLHVFRSKKNSVSFRSITPASRLPMFTFIIDTKAAIYCNCACFSYQKCNRPSENPFQLKSHKIYASNFMFIYHNFIIVAKPIKRVCHIGIYGR